MNDFSTLLPQSLIDFAHALPFPLYVVGGSVRDHFCGLEDGLPDVDLCAPVKPEVFISLCNEHGFRVKNVYKNTGTLKLTDKNGIPFEFSCFRSDKYVRGEHTPCEVFFTEDIELDARRRDFACNAVYYDVKNEKFLDPLGGIEDIQNKRLRTVKDADAVFSEDGLRLMRLARQAAQLGFSPTAECLEAARKHAFLLDDVHPQRIFAELKLLLTADKKSRKAYSHYDGLKILEETLVLARVLPELWEGKGLEQRKDFHSHDVLEHSLRCVKYIENDETLRLAALLHDVGKIPAMKEQGNCHNHEKLGLPLARAALTRLQAPVKQTEEVLFLISEHMYDYNAKTGERKLRRYLVENERHIPALLAVKQADFSACKDDLNKSPSVARWEELLSRMREEKVPFTLKELDVNGAELIQTEIPPVAVATVLHKLLLDCAAEPALNQKYALIRRARGIYKTIRNEQGEKTL